MNIIFLDIDGVINTGNAIESNYRFDPVSINHLNRLIEKFDAKLVISSTWRSSRDMIRMEEVLFAAGVPQGTLFHIDGDEEAWRISRKLEELYSGVLRGHVIDRWLEKYGSHVDRYVIFDDETDFTEDQKKNHLVVTDFMYGIGYPEYLYASHILSEKPDETKLTMPITYHLLEKFARETYLNTPKDALSKDSQLVYQILEEERKRKIRV